MKVVKHWNMLPREVQRVIPGVLFPKDFIPLIQGIFFVGVSWLAFSLDGSGNVPSHSSPQPYM